VTRALLVFAVTSACTTSVAQAAEVDPLLHADLVRIAQRRIFFGHQSVGVNLLDGINKLATMAGVPIHVVEVPTASEVPSATFGHTFIARNGYPLQKLKSFELALGQQTNGPDIALMKFCFLDITADTNVKELFARYRATIDELRRKNPGTTFVHVTAPLTDVQSGFKETLKKLIGRAPYGIIENIRREEYNSLLRQAYQDREPFFDLARIESTLPDGSAVTLEWKGSIAPMLAPMYTDDGAHLNDTGGLRASRELISILAVIPDRKAPSGLAR